MYINTFLRKTRSNLIWVILPLSVVALSAELLPEVKAKIIVVPTLVLMIALCLIELGERWWGGNKRRYPKEFDT